MKKIAMLVGEDFWLRIPMNNESAGRHLCMDDVEVIHAWLESGYGGCWTLQVETDGEQLEGVAVKVPGSRLGLGTYAVVMAGKFVNGGHFRTKRQLFIRLVDREEQADAKPTMFNEEKAYWAGPAVLSGMLSRDGLNTYELAVLHGYDGTLEQFLAQAGIELQDFMVTKAKLSREVQTQLDKGSEKAINPAGDYDAEAEYSVNEMVYDEVTNSSYVSKQSVNVGHAVTDTDWWMKVLDGNYVHTTIQAIMTAAQETLNEAKQDTIDATAAALAAKQATEQATTAANAVVAQKVADAQIGYYVCETAAGTATKATTTNTIGQSTFAVPVNGCIVKVKMMNANTATDTVYLQFGSDANTKKELKYNGLAVDASNTWEDGEVISVYYDGTYNNNAGAYFASNAQGGGGKAEKVKYENTQSGLMSDNVQDAIDNLSTQALPFEEMAFVTASSSGKWINNLSGSWETKSNTFYCLFNVDEGEVYKIHATSNGNSHVAFLTDNTTTGSAHFVSGTGVTLIPPSTSRKFEAPSGANYIYILVRYDGSDRTEKVERVSGILERVEELSENTTLGFADKIIVKSGLLDIHDGKSISAYTTRAITENYLPPQTLVTCNEGYYMRGIYRYTKNGEDFIFQDYLNWATTPYASIKLSNYYFRVLFQKGDGSEVVNSSDVIKSVQYGVEQLAGTELPTNVELGAYEISSPNFNPSKYNYPHRMSTGGLFSNAGAITVVCKDGYEANIAYYTRGVAVRYYGWKKEHIGVTQDYTEFAVFFRRADNGDVSDSDLDCVETFKYDNIIGENLLDKAVAPAVGYKDFTVSVDTGVADTVSETLALQDSQVFENDKGRIYLPATYSQYGKPTRLIIHCHGASQNYNNGNVFPQDSMKVTLDYLLLKGYAVMDVNGMPGTHSFFATTSGNPVALRSYIKAYEWAINTFNLYKEIFVVGISAGSIPALQMSNLDVIPVLASATYCGIMDFSRAWMLLGGYFNDSTQGPAIKSYLADKYAFVGERPTFGDDDPCSPEEWAYIVSNVKQFEGWNTFTMGITSTMTREQYREIVSVVYGSTRPDWIPSDYSFDSVQQMLLAFKIPQREHLSDYQTAIEQEKKLFDTCAIQRQVPIKLFHAVNDNIAPYRYSQYYYEMCKRGGSIAEFRTFPSGGHNPTGNTITQDGITTNVLTVELLNWLQRFE